MSYRTGTAQRLSDLMVELADFAGKHGGWSSVSDIPRGHLSIITTDLVVSFDWSPIDATGVNTFTMHQATGFVDFADPDGHEGDSGVAREVARPGAGPFQFWFFADGDPSGSTEPFYLHAVLLSSYGTYRHFGFGRLDKIGGYTGGEYVYGHAQQAGPGTAALSTDHSILLDGLYAGEASAATVRAEGLTTQEVSGSKYVMLTQDTTITTTDADGVGLEQGSGGFRGGIFASPFGSEYRLASDLFQPMYRVVAVHRAPNYGHGPAATVLGSLPGTAGTDITNIDAQAVRRVGPESWMFFPAAKKTTDNVDSRTDNIGIAYRIV